MHPVHGDAAPDAADKLMGDDPESRFSHHLASTLVVGQRVIEGDLLVREAAFLAPCPRRTNVLGDLIPTA
jgi:hypothetical protein